MRAAFDELAKQVSVPAASDALGVPRSTAYRWRRPPIYGPRKPRPKPARALNDAERSAVLEVLHSERFVDKAPGTIHATLLDEDQYLCHPRTMYRILHSQHEVRERRDQLRHPKFARPELLATAPNQVSTWDVTLAARPDEVPLVPALHHHRLVQPLQSPLDARAPRIRKARREHIANRKRVMTDAFARNANRFVGGPPRVPALPRAVWINPPENRAEIELDLL